MQLERRIEIDLSVAGLSPPLHLPMVAGLAQGPGFPNLSCLGLLSDRVLRRYVTREQDPAAAVTAPVRRHRGGNVSEMPVEAWECADCVSRTVVLPTELADRLAAEAQRRGLSVSDLLAEYARQGLARDEAEG